MPAERADTRETATKIYEAHDGADCDFCGALCPDDAAKLINAIDEALRQREERLIRVLGADEIEDLAHHAVGVWQAFEDSPLFANTQENWQRAHDAAEDARRIAEIAAAIRNDKGDQSG